MVATVLTLLISLLMVIILYLLFGKQKKAKHPLLVRAKGHPIFGNITDFKTNQLLSTWITFPLQYGPFIELFLFTRRILLITDATICREILSKRPKKFSRLSIMDYSAEVLKSQTSLFTSKGIEWSRIRKATVPSFSNLNVSSKVAMIAKEIWKWIQKLQIEGKKQEMNHHSSHFVDMKYEAFSLTVRIITVVAFGLSTDDPLCQYFVTQFNNDVNTIFRFTGESTIFPLPRFFWKYSSYYPLEIEAVAANNRVYQYGRKILDYKRDLVQKGQLQNNCMVDTMILNEHNSTEKALTDEEIIVNVRTFYIAGADTTAITIMWSTYYFATRPEILLKIRQEVTEILFQNQSPEQFMETFLTNFHLDDFVKLIYLNAFIKEILRTSAPTHSLGFNPHEQTEPIALSNGILIYPDDTVYCNIDGLHHDPKVFLNPKEFNPDRWLTSDAKQLELMENHFLPFGAGPRVCPGMGLAFQEIIFSLAFLSYYFNFALDCPKEEIQRVPYFVATATKMPIIFTPVKY